MGLILGSLKPTEVHQAWTGRRRNTLPGLFDWSSCGGCTLPRPDANVCQGVGHHGVHRLAVIVTAWSYKLELDEPTIILGGHMS